MRKDIAVSGTKKRCSYSKNELVKKDDDQQLVLMSIFIVKESDAAVWRARYRKTLLCQSAARYSSDNGRKTLFLCFNRHSQTNSHYH